MRVCQFRHDGKWTCFAAAARSAAEFRKAHNIILQTRRRVSNSAAAGAAGSRSPPYPSFALIVIFAFSTFDTGHPFSAASAYF